KGIRQTTIALLPHDIVSAMIACDVGGAVGRSIVDHQDFDAIDTVDPSRNGGDGRRQRLGLVVAGDLDDQLHCGGSTATPKKVSRSTGSSGGAGWAAAQISRISISAAAPASTTCTPSSSMITSSGDKVRPSIRTG